MNTEQSKDKIIKAEHHSRIARLQHKMEIAGIDLYLVTYNVDIYYLTGSMQTGYVLVPRSGEAVYFVKRSYPRAQMESIIRTAPLGSFRQFGETIRSYYGDLFQGDGSVVIATEFDVLPVQQYERLKAVIPGANWTDGSTLFRELRILKSAYELDRIRAAASAAHQVLDAAADYIQPGMTELELIAYIEREFRLQGHVGLIRMHGFNQELVTGMVASGSAAAEPSYFDGPAGGLGLTPASPQGSSRKIIEENEPVLIDIGCCIDGYVIDQTRTLVMGQLEEELQRAYDASEAILRATEKRLKPGTVCESLYVDALAMAESFGLQDHFMGYGEDQVKFLGHGIGMEIDEWPVLARGFKQPLQEGMVIAIEPKFTFPGRGVVGIENTYLITADGYETLTTAKEGLRIISSYA
ncbi:M24 family metallopeptidase [Paenibacillus alvei]|uniref:Aminopeptidase P family protein n=1 Tax=Paenibacillus alvei TaxID=44250 RepID=A0AAP6ZZD6_PAEAL|nr:Xaa-Pro peptidase family protein [Paenibacillus alvei]NOJ70033.1 aminopeptidase P family protein [Paenibacillus alvei]